MSKYLLPAILVALPAFAFAFGIVAPDNADPSDTISAKLTKSTQDPYIDSILWFLDDKPLKQDAETVTFNIKDAETATIKAVITDLQGKQYVLEKKINIAKLNIIWEAQTYTPFFYEGAPLPSYGSQINAQAVYNTDNPEKYVYKWELDGKVLQSVSGLGKYKARIQLGYLKNSSLLSVKVLDPETAKILSQKSVFIKYYKPKLYVYAKDELLGWRFNKHITDSFDLSYPKEMIVIPYFMNIANLFDKRVVWNWVVDQIPLPKEKISSPYVRLKFDNLNKESANLKIETKIKDNVFQNTELNLTLTNNRKKRALPDNKDTTDSGFGI